MLLNDFLYSLYYPFFHRAYTKDLLLFFLCRTDEEITSWIFRHRRKIKANQDWKGWIKWKENKRKGMMTTATTTWTMLYKRNICMNELQMKIFDQNNLIKFGSSDSLWLSLSHTLAGWVILCSITSVLLNHNNIGFVQNSNNRRILWFWHE